MKRAILIKLLLLLTSMDCIGQGIINNYLFGYTGPTRGKMNLYSGSPIINSDSITSYNLSYTHANISDSAGNLLFYTNGVVVMDGNHDTMPNGRGLNPCQYTNDYKFDGLTLYQGALILMKPNDPGKYYLLHQTFDYYSITSSSQIYYSLIDINLNNNMGDLSQKNISIFSDTLYGGSLTACRHANGRDWWLIVPKAFSPVYHVFLVAPNGISLSSTQTIGSRIYMGQAAFSPDGSHYGFYDYIDGMDIFDFDRCNGVFSNSRHVNVNDSSWGLGFCFSPDSKLAYAANAIYLYQFNLDSINLTSGMEVVAAWDSTYDPSPPFAATFEFMQIGPDGKIYMTTVWATDFMHYIEFPDSIGIACGMQQHSLNLPTYNANTIPNFINYNLGPVVGSVCDSLGLGVPEHVLHDFKFTIQPNPLNEKVLHCKYVLPQNNPGILEVLDLTGRILVREPLPEWSTEQHIRLNITAGIYEVKITSNKQQAVKKICVE